MTSHDVLKRLRLCLPRLAPLLNEEATLHQLGLDSMETVELLCVIHEEFGVRLKETAFQPQQPLNHLLAAIAASANEPTTLLA